MKLSDLPEEDGYRLWLRYEPVSEPLLAAYRARATELVVPGDAATLAAARNELALGLGGMLGRPISSRDGVTAAGAVLAGTPASSADVASLGWQAELERLGDEGYVIRSVKVRNEPVTVVASKTNLGILYGSFHLLRLIQTGAPIHALAVGSTSKRTRNDPFPRASQRPSGRSKSTGRSTRSTCREFER